MSNNIKKNRLVSFQAGNLMLFELDRAPELGIQKSNCMAHSFRLVDLV